MGKALHAFACFWAGFMRLAICLRGDWSLRGCCLRLGRRSLKSIMRVAMRFEEDSLPEILSRHGLAF